MRELPFLEMPATFKLGALRSQPPPGISVTVQPEREVKGIWVRIAGLGPITLMGVSRGWESTPIKFFRVLNEEWTLCEKFYVKDPPNSDAPFILGISSEHDVHVVRVTEDNETVKTLPRKSQAGSD